MAAAVAPSQRRSSRTNRGCNGRDVQLDRLGDQLTAPTRQKKRQFVPEDGLVLENNALAPQKKKRRSKKSQLAQPPPQPPAVQSQPCQQPADDGRYGFQPTPHTPQTATLSTPMQPRSNRQLSHIPHTSQLHPLHVPPSPHQVPSLSLSPHLVPLPPPHHLSLPHLHHTFPPHLLSDRPQLRHDSPSLMHNVSPPHSPHVPSLSLSQDFLQPTHFQSPPHSSFSSSFEPSDSEVNDGEGEELELEIDEHSDDEDDRQAHAFLRASSDHVAAVAASQPPVAGVQGAAVTSPQPLLPIGQNHLGFADLSADTSVLQNHYGRNRPPRAPRFQSTPVAPPTLQPPPGDADSKPRTLESYPLQWQQAIMRAKLTFRAYLAGECGFPDGAKGLQRAKACLDGAAKGHLEEGGILEPGIHVDKNMSMLVFNDSWQLRSNLKADIRVQVRNLKALFPDNGTQQQPQPPHDVRASIRDRVSRWTLDGSYLHDIIPASGEQVHFGHPIIASTCKSFYFDRWSDISASGRDTFRGSVPKPLVALVGTIYRNVLDEWSTGSPSTVKLESRRYAKVYNAILDSIEIVDKDRHYGPLFRQRLAAWAGFGQSINGSHALADIPVNIYLNLCPPTTG